MNLITFLLIILIRVFQTATLAMSDRHRANLAPCVPLQAHDNNINNHIKKGKGREKNNG